MNQNYSSVMGKPEPVAHPLNCNAECPYGKGKSFCFPCMAKIMAEHKPQYNLGLEDVLEIDRSVRQKVKEYFG